MPSERELKTAQEDRYFDCHLLEMLSEAKDYDKLDEQIRHMCERAQSGMSASEIDAVRERVSRRLKWKK